MANQVVDAMASLEARSEPVPEIGYPEMTMEHKAQVLLIQRQDLTIRNTIHQLQEQLKQMPQQMNALLNKICKDLKISPDAVTFDLDNLKIGPPKEK